MTLTSDQFKGLSGRLATDGGFTVNPVTGHDITSGISVAPFGNEHKAPVGMMSPAAIAGYHAANTERWTGARNASLGGWRSDDADYLDTPTVYKNTPQGQSAARKNMVLSSQEAGFDLDSFQEVLNPFHPTTRAKLGEAPHELADVSFPRDASGGRITDPALMTDEQKVDRRRRADLAMEQPEVQSWVSSPRQHAQWAREEEKKGSGVARGRSGALPWNGRTR